MSRTVQHPRRTPRAPLPAELRANDPLIEARSSGDRLVARVIVIVIAAVLAHIVAGVAIFGVASAARALGIGNPRPGDRKAPIEVAIVEPPPPPPEPTRAPEPEPEPEKKREQPKPEKKEEAPPPPLDPIDQPEDKPPEPPKEEKPARRIIGLNMESTVGGGGAGPKFAAGNSRMGTTSKRAEDTREVAPAEKTIADAPVEETGNRTATRIPTAGAKLVKPERKKQIEPAYPEKYRQQGIEADVVVRVSLDAQGKITGVAIVAPSTHAEFNEAAKEAAFREEFSPATKDGVAVPYTITYTYRFRLNG